MAAGCNGVNSWTPVCSAATSSFSFLFLSSPLLFEERKERRERKGETLPLSAAFNSPPHGKLFHCLSTSKAAAAAAARAWQRRLLPASSLSRRSHRLCTFAVNNSTVLTRVFFFLLSLSPSLQRNPFNAPLGYYSGKKVQLKQI